MRIEQIVCAAVVAVVLCNVGVAAAQDAAPSATAIRRAAEDFDIGRKAYRSEEYVEAAEHFESADARAPNSKALEFAIRSRRKAEQFDRAATLAALALQQYPDDARLRELAEEVIEESSEQLHRVSILCDSPCELVLGSTLVHGPPTTDRALYLMPGGHVLRASWPDSTTVTAQVEATAGGSSEANLKRPGKEEEQEEDAAPVTEEQEWEDEEEESWEDVKPEEPAEPPPESAGLPPAVFWSGVGLTAVGVGLTTWSGVDTLNNPGKEAVREECEGIGTECRTWKQAKLNELRTNIRLGATAAVGVATAIIGAVATDWGQDGSDAASGQDLAKWTSPSVQPWIGIGHGATVGAVGRF